MTATVGQLAEGTIEMIGSFATEHILGRVTHVSPAGVTIEGQVTVRTEPGKLPVEVELPLTITLSESSIEVLE